MHVGQRGVYKPWHRACEQPLVNMESNKRIQCKQCEKSYVHRRNLLRHIRNKHGKEQSKSRSLLKRSVTDENKGTKKIKLSPLLLW